MDAGWLKAQLDAPGRSQAALARFMKLDTSAVNRMCSGARQIKANEADQIRAYLIGTTTQAGNRGADNLSLDVPTPEGATFVTVEGAVEAGAWREPGNTAPGPSRIPVVARAMFEGDVYALLVQGSSMNVDYPDGSYVLVRPWNGGPLPFGKDVVVRRERPDGLVEHTVKELRPAGDFPELWPRSHDPRHKTPIRYGQPDDVSVEIIGRVIASLRFND